MKSLRRGTALTVAAAAAIGAACVGWSGSAAVVAKRTPTATVEGVAVAGRSGDGAPANPLAPDVLATTDACPFCLEGIGLAFDAEPSDILAQQSLGAEPAGFDDGLNRLASVTPDATAAPASKISTAAMATFGAIGLMAWGGRRRGRPSWQAPWRSPATAESF